MVGLVYVSNSLGTINPAKQMVQMAHDAGAFALVDGAQAGPHIAIDVQDLDADFLTLSCHKMYAPTGIGVLYGKRAHLEAMPPYQGGGDMIRTVSFEKTTYAPLPFKFEAGTPNISAVIGLGAAVEWLGSLSPSADLRSSLVRTMDAIHHHEVELMRYASALLADIPGVHLQGTAREKAGVVSFTTDFAHPHDLGTILDNQGIAVRAGHHCCMPLMKRLNVPATARASFALYNTREEAERLAQAVIRAKEIMG
jgi:cysteine desulfurase/selenocysteine lyase